MFAPLFTLVAFRIFSCARRTYVEAEKTAVGDEVTCVREMSDDE